MNLYRLTAMALATCAAGISLAACDAGITSAKPPASSSHSPGLTPSAAAGSHSSPTSISHAGSVSAQAPIGSFPIPPGAQVFSNLPCGKEIIVELSSVTPAHASSFYASALPRSGYKITDNTLTSNPDTGAAQGLAEITFTGRGYTGLIIAVADLGADASASPSVSGLPSSIAKNDIEIALTPRGTHIGSTCPN
jgi:hypothetical protein